MQNKIANNPYLIKIAFFNYFFLVSGEVPETPVVSPVSNHVFEKRLIEKFITENGTDPITGDSLSESDLIEINSEFL